MANLADKTCIPCTGGVPPLDSASINELLAQLDGWKLEKEYHLARSFVFPNFVTALAFVNRVGELAEQQGHHPDIYLAWGLVKVEIWTHKIKGLTESDFILAARIDRLPR
ncbi:MAG: 4a-hydroxytetrahydrobiopterin dehydratase [Phycisphaerae bacterium]|nr:4a-hydroxytetrahydrobiopterin dehydratase [Phycisphaerae bacterium]